MGLFGFVKKLVGGVVGTVIPGPIGGFVGRAIAGGSPQRPGMPAGFGSPLPAGSRVQRPTPGVVGAVQRFLPGGATGFTTIPPELLAPRIALPPALIPRGPGGLLGAVPGVPGGITGFGNGDCPPGAECPKGHHLNRSNYFLNDGTFIPAGSRCVANRRRNPENFRANRRAAGRLLARKRQADRMDKALASLAPKRGRRASVPKCP